MAEIYSLGTHKMECWKQIKLIPIHRIGSINRSACYEQKNVTCNNDQCLDSILPAYMYVYTGRSFNNIQKVVPDISRTNKTKRSENVHFLSFKGLLAWNGTCWFDGTFSGGTEYCLVLCDVCTHFPWWLPLHNINHVWDRFVKLLLN